ncbi:hypothetical protein A2415_03950 [candidate division WWE3 bacterium RIFOXYC1_FULL_39_7]|uniref:Uncharacterized protein n=2 Tax=Katanobacteria TaxID=422282 RepID=A0A1F4X968_UNCKA|nr:MAG: hypothetical protein A2415_03950 [candidate division WWE3 bacterium RIFOXYC1_FULL_39_7]OGC78237.1 MAG: hypothetical protein A2619_02745 [candidate division WWE3 bacterium RIFOXYD1_FULL_39_9]
MLKKVEILTSINYSFYTTVYLFDREEKIVLPADISRDLDSKQTTSGFVKNILALLQVEINNIQILIREDETLFSQIILEKDNELMCIPAELVESLEFVKNWDIPILIESSILKKQGIKITPELLREALEQD